MNTLRLKILLFLRQFSNWYRCLIYTLFDNIISIVVLILFYIFLWYFDQAQDLLLILNQRDYWYSLAQVPLYFFSLSILANTIWNAPKYLNRWNAKKITISNFITFIPDYHYTKIETLLKSSNTSKNKVSLHMKIVLPRVLGILLLSISSLSILKAIQDYQITTTLDFLNPSSILLTLILLCCFILHPRIYTKIKSFIFSLPHKRILLITLLSISFIVILYLGFINKQNRQDLVLLFYAHNLLVFLFTIFSFFQKELLKEKRSRTYFYGFSMLSILFYILLFLILNIFIPVSSQINPLSIFVISIIAYISISAFIIFIGKLYRISLFSYSLIVLIVLSVWNQKRTSFEHYKIETLQQSKPINRTPIEYYIDQWIERHYNQIIDPSRTKPYPIFFVSAQGGGSKGGLWTSLIHYYLHQKTNGDYFKNHLFLLTGASGGNVGNALYFSYATHHSSLQNPISSTIQTPFGQFYRKNFLSSSMTSFLGRDLIQSLFGVSFCDNRAELLEKEWENTYQKTFKTKDNILGRDFLSFYNETPSIPLLMINSTHVQTGLYTTISPVSNHFKGIQDFYQTLGHYKGDRTSIKLSTALNLGASFPFINSAGELKGYGQYVDAGYYDNIGGIISENVYDLFKERLTLFFKKKFPDNYALLIHGKVRLINLILVNDPFAFKEKDKTNSNPQFDVPLTTLANTRSGHTYHIQKDLKNPIELSLKNLPVFVTNDTIEVTPILPLGRYLSKIAVQSIENNLVENKFVIKQLDELIYLMNEN